MKNKLYLAVFSTLILSQSTTKQCSNENRIKIEYIGYSRDVYNPDFPSLQFEITNNSEDTLYLSEKNIIIEVRKNKILLDEEKVSESIATPFIKPRLRKLPIDDSKIIFEKQIQKIKNIFAERLFASNFGKNSDFKDEKDFIVDNIVRDCIVLLPRQSINYNKGFRSKIFDKNCSIHAEYSDNSVFTYFIDNKGNTVDIIY